MREFKPTEKELELHRRANERLKEILFSKPGLADLMQMETMEVLPPSIEEITHNDSVKRAIALGGLKFKIKSTKPHSLSINHSEADRFNVWISYYEREQWFTRFASVVIAKDLRSKVIELVKLVEN